MKKKVFLVLLFSLVSLAILPLCKAVVTPVEVERVKDVGFVRMRGDHNTQSFLFHYVNLSPQTQEVKLEGIITTPGGKTGIWMPTVFVVQSGDSLDISQSAGYGYLLEFTVSVKPYMIIAPWTVIIDESVIIPPSQ